MWCPKCKSEFRDGFSVCAECGTPLVEQLPLEPSFDPVYLTKTEGDGAWELPELLHRAGIACYLYGGNGLFIRMEPEQAVPGELYVDSGDLSAAQRCVALVSEPPQPMDEEVLLEAYEESLSAPAEPDEPQSGSGVMWKVFLAMAALAVLCVLASILWK